MKESIFPGTQTNFHGKLSRRFIVAIAFGCIALTSCKKDDDNAPATTTGRTTTVNLLPTDGSNVSGTAVFEENVDHTFNIRINLQNSLKDSMMPIDIHNGSYPALGRQAIDLGTIKGTGGAASGVTNNIGMITDVNGNRVTITYDSVIVYKGVINVSESPTLDHHHLAYGNIH